MSRKLEISLGLIIIIVIASFFGYKFLEDRIDTEAGLEDLEEAIMAKDLDYLEDYIEIEGLGRELTRTELENIVDILSGRSISSLKKKGENPDSNIFLIEEGWGIINPKEYRIGLKTYDLKIEENPAGTEVFINDELVGSFVEGEDFSYEDLIPGYHKITLSYQGELGKMSAEDGILAFQDEASNQLYLALKVPERYIEISSSEEKAELILDGEQTSIKIYEPYELGPLGDEEVTISARALIDGELYESESYRIDSNSGGSYYLEIDYDPGLTDEEIISRMDALIHSYEASFVHAVNSGDDHILRMYMQRGSPLMKSQQKLIKDLYEEGIKEDLVSYEIKNVDIISQEEVLVTVEEDHIIYYSDGSREEVNNTWTYTAVYENEMYLLRELK